MKSTVHGKHRTYTQTAEGSQMFGIFRDRKTKLEKRYQQLLAEAHRLSHIDRKKSDFKAAEADEVRKELEALEAGIESK